MNKFFGIKGVFDIIKKDGQGNIIDNYHFENLVLNSGLDLVGKYPHSTEYLNDCFLGSGNSEPALRVALKEGVKIPITDNITLNELLASDTASRYNIDNIPNQKVLEHLIEASINLWQVARDILGVPIIITSGYRCEALNRRVGGVKNSSHKHGLAIDFRCPKFGSTRAAVAKLKEEFTRRNIAFDQLILEYPDSPRSWVHLGFGRGNRGQVFRIG